MGLEIEKQTNEQLSEHKNREIERWQNFQQNADFHKGMIDAINEEQVKRLLRDALQEKSE